MQDISVKGEARWFTDDDLVALRDYWDIYERHYEELQQQIFEWAQGHPALAAVPPDELDRQSQQSRRLISQAIATGDFSHYAQHSRPQGVFYATLGIRFGDWFEFVGWYGRLMLPRLGAALQHDPPRMLRAIAAMQRFLDRTLSELGDTYIATKEAALQASEQRFRLLIDAIGDYAIYMVDIDGCVQMWTAGAERIKQYRADDVVGTHFSRFFVGAHARQHCQRMLAEAISHGRSEDSGWHLRLDGSHFWSHTVITPVRSSDGSILGFVCVNQDRTAARVAEEALRKSEGTLAATLSAIQVGVVIANPDGEIVYRNPAAQELTTSHSSSIRDVPPVYYLDGRVCPVDEYPMACALRGETCRNVELMIDLPGRPGRPGRLYISASAAPIRAADGRLLGAVTSIHDTSLQRQLEEQKARAAELRSQTHRYQEANRLKSEFLANMSHELRTPLNAIIGFAELLHGGQVPPDAPEHQDFLGDILSSGRHLLQLINDVLDLAKIESGKMDFRPEPVELGQLIGEVVSILRSLATQKRIAIVTEVAPHAASAILDPRRFKQVLYNYLSNALKFTPDGGRVTVRTLGHGDDYFRLEVEDNGIGISEEDQKRLFIDFQQLESGSTKKHGGTGLGLALTKRLVEAQRGSVAVHSTPGKGCTFSSTLPRMAAVAVPGQSSAATSAAASVPRILVIEDNPHERAQIAAVLLGAGYAVDQAANGTQAVALAQQHAYEAITLDLLMPENAGQDVLAMIRALPNNSDVPAIVVTLVAQSGVVVGRTVVDILTKPLDSAALLQALRRARGQRRPVGEVMVIDDDPISQRLTEAALSTAGYTARCYSDGTTALAACQTLRPVAIVLDLLMPGMSGFEFLDLFRSIPECRSVPVLIWTIKDLSPDEHAQAHTQAQAVAQKGRGSTALLDELRAVLSAFAHERKEGG